MNTEKRKTAKNNKKATQGQIGAVAYRFKCANKTANGLSHFVMYGDVQKNKALL